jgi:hypothetical protein
MLRTTALVLFASGAAGFGSTPPEGRTERKYCSPAGVPMMEQCPYSSGGGCGEMGACLGESCKQFEYHTSCMPFSWADPPESGVSSIAECRSGVHTSIHFSEAGCNGNIVAELPESAWCYQMGPPLAGSTTDEFLGACPAQPE